MVLQIINAVSTRCGKLKSIRIIELSREIGLHESRYYNQTIRMSHLKMPIPKYAKTIDSQTKDNVLIVCCIVIWVTGDKL